MLCAFFTFSEPCIALYICKKNQQVLKFAAFMDFYYSFIFFWFFYHYVYGCMFCILLFNSISYVFLLLCLCILIVMYVLFYIFSFHSANWLSSATLTEVFPYFFLSCKANARLAKTGHSHHSSQLVNCAVLFFVCM